MTFDVYFEIGDMEGTTLGRVGGTQDCHGAQEPGVQGNVLWASCRRGPNQDQEDLNVFVQEDDYQVDMHDAQRDRLPWSIEIESCF